MTLQSLKLACESLCLLAVAASAGYVAVKVGSAADASTASMVQITATASTLNKTLVSINQPCAPGPCGTIPSMNKAIVKIGDAVVTTQLQERAIVPATIAAMNTLNASAGKFGQTADALTGTAQAATTSLGTLDTSVAATKPLLASLTATSDASTLTIKTFNGRLSDPRVDALLTDFSGMAKSGNGILADGKTVSDKFAADYTKKQTPWMRFLRLMSDTYDFGALAARHTP